MQNLTKAQVIALFVSSTSATAADFLAAHNQIATTPNERLTDGQIAWPFAINRAGECTTNASCQAAIVGDDTDYSDQRCADVYSATNDAISLSCINYRNCGNLGYFSQVAYRVNCLVDAATEAPTRVEVVPLIETLQSTILRDDQSTFTAWGNAGMNNLILTAKDQFMGGFWESRDSDSLWALWNKTEIEKCTDNASCEEGQSCAWWPDQNNLRCQLDAVCGVEQTLAPFANWTPTCIEPETSAPSGPPGGDDDIPISGLDNLAEKNRAKAAAEVVTFDESVEEAAKLNAKYDDMTDAQKTAWDTERAKLVTERETFDAKLRTDAGYETDACDDDCKAIFDAEFLEWKKDVFETCKTTPDSIECRDANAIKTDTESRRNTAGWYSKDVDARKTWNESDEAEVEKNNKALVAAFMKDNAPASGKDGSTCSGETECGVETQCCGVSTPEGNSVGVTTGQLDDICVDKTSLKYTDGLGRQYKHMCDGAKALLASASALIAATYLM